MNDLNSSASASDPAGGTSSSDRFQSVMFQAPGRPRPLARRLAIHNRVAEIIGRYMIDNGMSKIPVPPISAVTGTCEAVDTTFNLDHCGDLAFPTQTAQMHLDGMIAQGFPAVWSEIESLRREWKVDERHLTSFRLIEAEVKDLDLTGLCELQEDLLKHVAANLSADLLGGRHVTRLDRMITVEHPRVTYREALDILNSRGWSMPFGEDLHRDAEASLVRYCGNLPVLVTHLPAELKLFSTRRTAGDESITESVEYILPYAGETFDGGVRESDAGVLETRLRESDLNRQLRKQAERFATMRLALRPLNEQGPDLKAMTRSFEQGIQGAFDRYLDPFRGRQIQRAGFGFGIARLLQYLMGLESIKDAIIEPLDRTSFASPVPHGAGDQQAETGSA